jgi:hypothetical protein
LILQLHELMSMLQTEAHFPEVLKKSVDPLPALIPPVQSPVMRPNRGRITPFARRMHFTIVDLTILNLLTRESRPDEG